MTISVSVAQGLGYAIGQRLYFGGKFRRILHKAPVTEKNGTRVIGFLVTLENNVV